MENQCVVWVSVDPVRRKVEFYPKSIAQRLEKHLKDNNENIYNDNKISSCYLGTDFFNATVHLRNNGFYYQTTPGISFGPAGYKQPGYRSVRRFIVNEEIPIEFICCISQDIMTDPVKTSDGFIYDRKSIEKWFENSNKSPLTGLELNNKTLTTNNVLKSIITKYIEEKIN